MESLNPFLIIVTGRPASGKSTLANWLSKELQLPVISKDNIREILFDQLGWSDRKWAQQLGRVSIDLMFYFAQTQLVSGHSIIIDNAFHPELSTPRFKEIKEQTNAEIVQIICDAESKVLFKRFMERARNDKRHPGHGDLQIQNELWQNLTKELSPVMEVGNMTIKLDTADFSAVDYLEILAKIRNYIGINRH